MTSNKKHPLEDKMARLREALEDPWAPAAEGALRSALADRSPNLVAKAAEAIGEHRLAGFEDDLVRAFDRFMNDPAKSDPGCLAKVAAAEALYRLEVSFAEPFLRGLRHVQMEPVWGKSIDTAGNLRGLCGLALATMGYPDIAFELTSLLMDPEVEARRWAAEGLSVMERTEGELLLRLKVLAGDPEPGVTVECLASLMKMNAERSLDFVAARLGDASPVIAEGAAIALGESRSPAAFERLRAAWRADEDPPFRRMLLLPIALLRRDESFDFLVRVIEKEHPSLAGAAIAALKMYESDVESVRRVRQAALARRLPALMNVFKEQFDMGS